MGMVKKIESCGVQLSIKGEKLRIDGQTKNLSESQIQWLKDHKPQIMAELRKRDPATRLRKLAGKYRIDPDRVLDWYRQDTGMIEGMDETALDALVRDYAANQDTFTGKQPYETYQLWLYKVGKQALGYTRQGVMTTNKAEALKRLEAIYGAGNVFELHKEGEKPSNQQAANQPRGKI